MKNKKRIRTASLFLSLIFLSGVLLAAPAVRAYDGGPRYIVKIVESADHLRSDRQYPFDVVTETKIIHSG